ncbi:MAG: ATP-binding protein [Pseudomonadota bacterium]
MTKEHLLLRRLADHYCAAFLVRMLDGVIHNLNGPFQILYVRSEQLSMNIKQLYDGAKDRTLDDSKLEGLAARMYDRIRFLLAGLDDLNKQHFVFTSGMLLEKWTNIQPIHLNSLIEDTVLLLNADMFFKHTVEKVYKFADNIPPLFGRRSEFGVMLLCVIENALSAMAQSETRRLEIGTSYDNDKGVITLYISDTGCGIPDAELDNIFSPFFASDWGGKYKLEKGKGTGIGLALVDLLIKEYGGNITCKNRSGETMFMLDIPARPEGANSVTIEKRVAK